MSVEIIFVKRKAREGEMGLFIETPVFEEEWESLKIGVEVKAICTVPANLKYIKFFHALCGSVAGNCDWLIDKDDAKERILLEAHFAKFVHDPLRNKTEIKRKSVARLSGDEWLRLIKRCVYVVITKFMPGMPENDLKAEIASRIGMDIFHESKAAAPHAKAIDKPKEAKNAAETAEELEPVKPSPNRSAA